MISNKVLFFLISFSIVNSTSFNWYEYKKELIKQKKINEFNEIERRSLFSNFLESDKESNSKEYKETQKYIKDNYELSVDKISLKEIKENQLEGWTVGMYYQTPDTWERTETSIDYSNGVEDPIYITDTINETQSPWGIFINSKLDFSSIGKKAKGLYGHINFLSSQFSLGISKRIFFNKKNKDLQFFADFGGLMQIQMKDEGDSLGGDISPAIFGDIGLRNTDWAVSFGAKSDFSPTSESTFKTRLNLGVRF